MSKLTTEDFIRKARAKHGDFYSYDKSDYTGAHALLTITCPEHGDFQQRAGDHANVGKGCKLCGVRRSSPAAFTVEHFISEARKTHGDFYDYSKVIYTTYKQLVSIVCPVHGEFQQRAGQHLRGNGCPSCRSGNKVSIYRAKTRAERCDEWKVKAATAHGGRYDYSRAEFVNSKITVEIVCPEHGSFFQSPCNHLHGRCACPECAIISKSSNLLKSSDKWVSEFRAKHGDIYNYDITENVASATCRIPITCSKHGVFLQQAYVHLSGHGCPKCANQVSTPEGEVYDWLVAELPDSVVLRGKRNVIPPYELDAYIPDKSLALEFNGTYWHCDDLKEKLYHQKKSLMCRERGILLLHIYEYDWSLRREACERLIRGKLGVGERKLNARSLVVAEVGHCSKFLEENHFQGSVASAVRYGLFDGDNMVALMTFGRSRYNKSYTWELLRFCVADGTRIRGGASKLFSRFTREHLKPADTVVSFARLDYSAGGVYEAMGFAYDGVCSPDYVWTKQPGVVLRRQSTQKHRLAKLLGNMFDTDKSEAENMKRSGYKRVYSAGNLRYVYTHA